MTTLAPGARTTHDVASQDDGPRRRSAQRALDALFAAQQRVLDAPGPPCPRTDLIACATQMRLLLRALHPHLSEEAKRVICELLLLALLRERWQRGAGGSGAPDGAAEIIDIAALTP